MRFKEQLAVEEETGEEIKDTMGIRTKTFSSSSLPGYQLRLSRLVWKHLGTGFACLAMVYMCYMMTVSLGSGGRGSHHLVTESNWEFLMARDAYLQSLLNSSGGGVRHCPQRQPVLSRLERYTDTAHYLACIKLFYNRVPKCGSRSVMGVIKELGRRYNYTVIGATKPTTKRNYFKNFHNLKTFVSNFSELAGPVVYSQHLHFVNFSRFGQLPPIYINVVRDPVERLISHYYYKSYGSNNAPANVSRINMTLDECVSRGSRRCLGINVLLPFFCGHDQRCRRRRDGSLLQIAKRTVREAYMLVGLTEDLPAFMEMLETLLPYFFYNASQVFREMEGALHLRFKTYKKPEVSPETLAILKDHLSKEYELYQYIQQRFYTLSNKLKALKRNLAKKNRLKEKAEFLHWWKDTT